ncbi:chorismate--pyruvate lyase family protein [Thiohalobacter sp.]|uniref:chorismate--pyruvate lyase family protein n=1 Tax=Thiohalobacter sp. TaxID=2025948 RepID=UPI002610EC5C|nr:chorismate lyase [Thiohalobacter sp.]
MPHSTGSIRTTGPRWARAGCYRRSQLTRELRQWLLDPASLTRRLVDACPGRFRVRVEFQGWGRPRRDEAQALGLRDRRFALIREVHLFCDDTPWVFARTVIPARTLGGRRRRLARLGERPLGAVLFADPGMAREPVELAAIRPGSELYRHAVAGTRARPAVIWGRRSVFRLDGRPLLVSEIFLPRVVRALSGCRA